MTVIMSGIDHRQAKLDVRGIFSFSKNQQEQICRMVLEQPDMEGCVIISTCNRTEIWISTSSDRGCDPTAILCLSADADPEKYRTFFTERRDTQAVDHLFRLAAGLESRILGEDQIITQVGDALSFARSINAVDSILEVLFRQAVTAAKRAKTEAFLTIADHSVIHAAVAGLRERGISIQGRKCMVIGNGMMGKLAARTLKEEGGEVLVTVRRYHHKSVEIPQGCIPIEYQDRYSLLPACDVIVSATSSPHYTLKYEMLKNLCPDHEIYLIDLAVPRDIQASAAKLPGYTLFDVDSFQIDLQTDQLKDNLRKIENIIREEEENFFQWYTGRDCVPQIRKIKDAAGQDAMMRMIPYLRHIPLDSKEKGELKQEIAGASGRMMNHLLFSLRTQVKEDTFRDVLTAMQQILNPSE